MTENLIRVKRFTSSCAYKLIPMGTAPMNDEELAAHKIAFPKSKKQNKESGFSALGLGYIEEKNIEIKLDRCINTEAYSKSMEWGKFLEARVWKKLPYGYEMISKETFAHPTINFWAGSPDFRVPGIKISELKCYEPKHFSQYTDALLTKKIEVIRTEHPEEYWQAVSNAIILNVPKAELISYMPYRSELAEIREEANDYDGLDQWRLRFIAEGEDCDLPYLPDNGYYKNLNIFEFTVPQEDIDYLTQRIRLAGSLLIKSPLVETV